MIANNSSHLTTIQLATFILPPTINRASLETQPLTYVSGGLLGDFIHQLSVVHQNYLNTGRRAILYITDIGDPFRKGYKATHAELYPIIMAQPYISEFKAVEPGAIPAGAINLSIWRGHQVLCRINNNWHTVFKAIFGIPWGMSPWLSWTPTQHLGTDNLETKSAAISWEGYTVINTTRQRFPPAYLFEKFKENGKVLHVRYICFDAREYDFFIEQTKLYHIPCHIITTLTELIDILAVCKQFVGSFSSPFAFAMAMYKPCYGAFLPWGPEELFKPIAYDSYLFYQLDGVIKPLTLNKIAAVE
jgi:hypothetical protein